MSQIPESPGSGAASSGHGVVSHGWLADTSEFTHADERKMGRAMSASIGVHGAAVLMIALIIAWRPPVEPPAPTPRETFELTFVQVAGPGGGGGGGGNQSQAPPAKLEMKAEIPKPPKIDVPKVDVPPPPPLAAPIQTNPTMPIPTAGTITGLSAAPALGTGTGGGGGTGRGTGSGSGTGSGIGPGTGGGFGGGAFRPGTGADDPVLLKKVEPKYTPEAMRAKIQGVVELEAVIGTNGQVTDIRVYKSLDRGFGLDEEAMRVARQWLFRPARYQGKPVEMVVIIQMEFRLH